MLTFTQLLRPPKRKTDSWGVSCKGHPLGTVKWYAGWRRYCFFPTLSTGTLFDASCLKELAEFCDTKTQEHKA